MNTRMNFRTLFENAAFGVVYQEPDGRIVATNRAAERILGLSGQDLTGRTSDDPRWQSIHDDGSPFPGDTHPAMISLRTGKPVDSVVMGVWNPVSLARVWLLVSAVPEFRAGETTASSVFTVLEDITERRRAAEVRDAVYQLSEAAASARSLDDLFARAREILGTLIPTRNFYVALLDREREMLHFPYFVDEADPPPAPKPLGRGLTEYVIRTGEPLLASQEVHDDLVARGEIELLGAPSIDWLGAPLKASGKVIGAVVVQTYAADVRYTASDRDLLSFISGQLAQAIVRKRAEEGLRDSEQRYRLLFEKNPSPMWVFDETTLAFLAVNESACRHYGYRLDEFLGMTIQDIRAPEVPALLDHIAVNPSVLKNEGVWKHRRKDGTVIDVEITSDKLVFGGREAHLVHVSDVTQKRRLEAQLRQSQRMEAIGRLAGGVAHDFNNALTVISGSVEALLGDTPADDPRHGPLIDIRKASERAAILTQQLLAFGRKQMLQPVFVDAHDVAARVARMCGRLLGEDIEIRTDFAADPSWVKVDPGQFEQVIINFALNARDAMPTGGRITIRTLNVEPTGPGNLEPAVGAGLQPRIAISVSDTGTGMTPEVKARIFEPFFTTKEFGKGSGLGLATTFGFVQQSGGDMTVESEPGKGATFTVVLPTALAPRSPGSSSAKSRAVPRGTETVLVVEDEDAVRRIVKTTLGSTGYRVIEARNGSEALEAVRRHAEEVRLVITDVVMPGMSGREVAERVTREWPSIRILLMSGYTNDAIERHGVESGVAFLQKPFSPLVLARAVRDVLDQEAPVPHASLPREVTDVG